LCIPHNTKEGNTGWTKDTPKLRISTAWDFDLQVGMPYPKCLGKEFSHFGIFAQMY
jgi:hypothetical protein